MTSRRLTVLFPGWLLPVFLLCFGLSACKSEQRATRSHILVNVYTDFTVPDDLDHLTATLLDPATHRETNRKHEFVLQEPRSGEEASLLLSFGVEGGASPRMLLRLTGGKSDSKGGVERKVEQTFEAHFLEGKTGVLVAYLSSRCVNVFGCGEGTCDPERRACGPLKESKVFPVDELPDDVFQFTDPDAGGLARDDAGMPGNSPVGGGDADAATLGCRDSHCVVAPCPQCPGAIERSCVSDDDCCEGPHCQPLSCEPGFADCNSLESDGCEAELATSQRHCGGCFQACPYTECREGQCPVHVEGWPVDEDATPVGWLPGRVHAFRLINTLRGRVASLGLRVQTPNEGRMYIALYEEIYDEDAGFGFPYTRLLHSGEVSLADYEAEWIIPVDERPLLAGVGEGYWLYFTVSETTHMYTAEGTHMFWMSAPTRFGPIDEVRLNDVLVPAMEGLPAPSLFMKLVTEDAAALPDAGVDAQ